MAGFIPSQYLSNDKKQGDGRNRNIEDLHDDADEPDASIFEENPEMDDKGWGSIRQL